MSPLKTSRSNNVILVSGCHTYNKFEKIYFLNSFSSSYFHSKERELCKYWFQRLALHSVINWPARAGTQQMSVSLSNSLKKEAQRCLEIQRARCWNINLNPPPLSPPSQNPLINTNDLCNKEPRKWESEGVERASRREDREACSACQACSLPPPLRAEYSKGHHSMAVLEIPS